MIELHKDIFRLFKIDSFNWDEDVIGFDFSNEAKDILEKHSIKYEHITRNKTLLVESSSLPVRTYKEFKDYLKLNVVSEEEDAIILNFESKPYSLINKVTYIDFIESHDNFFFSNAFAYSNFISFFKSQETDSEDAFHFVDYVNDVTFKIVFTSLSDKGRLIVKYFNELKHLDEKTDYHKSVSNFKKCFDQENQHLPKFIKTSIIEYAQRYESKSRIYDILENLDIIVQSAKINFEIYLNNLSVDKIRKEYAEYKSKYFKELTEVLNNLTQKIIGLPILIATTLFAIEKVKTSSEFLILIILTIIVTNVYLVFLLKINFKDLSYVRDLSDEDYDILISNNFFNKFPDQKLSFIKIKERITSRVSSLKFITHSYYWILGITNIIIIGLIFFYLGVKKEAIVMITLSLLFIIAYFRNEILNENEDKTVS